MADKKQIRYRLTWLINGHQGYFQLEQRWFDNKEIKSFQDVEKLYSKADHQVLELLKDYNIDGKPIATANQITLWKESSVDTWVAIER